MSLLHVQTSTKSLSFSLFIYYWVVIACWLSCSSHDALSKSFGCNSFPQTHVMSTGFRTLCVELVMTLQFLRWPVGETVVRVTFCLFVCLFVYCYLCLMCQWERPKDFGGFKLRFSHIWKSPNSDFWAADWCQRTCLLASTDHPVETICKVKWFGFCWMTFFCSKFLFLQEGFTLYNSSQYIFHFTSSLVWRFLINVSFTANECENYYLFLIR